MSKSGTVDKKAIDATLTSTTTSISTITDPVPSGSLPVTDPVPAPVTDPAPTASTTTLFDQAAAPVDTGGAPALVTPADATVITAATITTADASAAATGSVPAPVDPVASLPAPVDTVAASGYPSTSNSFSVPGNPVSSPMPFTVVTDGQTAVNALLGNASGIEVHSVQLNAAAGAVSRYDGSIGSLSIGPGLLLTSGNAAPGTSNTMTGFGQDNLGAGDADLTQIVQTTYVNSTFNKATYDAASLEFSFAVTDPNAHSVSFDLVFGSEEFPEYVDSYVDIAAVIVNGVNVAYFDHDAANPLSVVSQNVAAGYFIDNAGNQISIEYDGVSRLLHVVAPVDATPGRINTIRIAIADTGDHILDSGIFVANFHAGDDPGYGVTAYDHHGTSGSDDVAGGTQAEYFDLQLGDDSLNAGAGDDIVLAGVGNDSIIGGAGDDAIDGGLGDDSARYHGLGSQFVITRLANGDVQVVDTTGAEGTDVLRGVEKLNFDDVTVDLTTYFDAPAAAAPVPAAPIPVVVEPVPTSTTTPAPAPAPAPEPAPAPAPVDLLVSGTGSADNLVGGAGNDTLDGGLGADTMSGGAGNDSYVADDRKDVVVEATGGGVDTVQSSTDLALAVNVENLVLTGTGSANGLGNALDNVLTGNAGKNDLNGGAGQDTIGGGAGIDLLTGGAGNDVFVFAAVSDAGVDAKKADVITDFGGADLIDLQLIDSIAGSAVDDAFSWIGGAAFHKVAGELRFDAATGNLSGDVNGDGKADFYIHLDGVAAASALDGHFVF